MGQAVLAVQNGPAAVVRILETRIAERLELARNLHEGGRRIVLWQKNPTADKAAITSIRSELVYFFEILRGE